MNTIEKEYLYHFTSVENLLKIVISDNFMLNSISNVNDLNESENFYKEIVLDDNNMIREYIYDKNNFQEMQKKYNEPDIRIFVETNINTLEDIEKNKNKFDCELWNEIMKKFRCKSIEYEELDMVSEEELLLQEFKNIVESCISDLNWLRDATKKHMESLCQDSLKPMVGEFIKNIYIGCFNSSIDDETAKKQNALWAHYGKLYSGVAIKFSKKKLLEKFSQVFDNEVNNYLTKGIETLEIIKNSNTIENNSFKKYTEEKMTEDILNYLIIQEKLDNYVCNYTINESNGNFYGSIEDKLKIENKGKEKFIELNPDYKNFRDRIEKIIKERYFLKDTCWDYEKEYRFLIYIHKFDKTRVFIEDINEAIEGVILGKKISEADRTVITKLGEKFFGKTNFIIE